MLRVLQKVCRFKVSEFKVAVEKMEKTKEEQWRKELPQPVKAKLQELYKQATQDYKLQTPYGCVGKQDEEETQFWAKHMSFSQEAARSDYVSYVHAILLEQKKSIYDPDPLHQ